jgi:phosphate acyltransferase
VQPTRVAVDVLGGDRAPEEIVAGAVEARSETVQPVLFGPATIEPAGLELVQTTQEIEMHEKPAEAVRAKPESSLVAACRSVGRGDTAAVVSAGNTGAMLAASLLEIRRLRGVMRPAIAVVIPSVRGPSVLIDAGANAESRPEHLLQFATMGAIFAEEVLELPEPDVGLLSIGEEAAKGNQATQEAHRLLAESDLRFKGNVESRWLLEGAADVVVTDGFTGNVALKALEGGMKTLVSALFDVFGATPDTQAAADVLVPHLLPLYGALDPNNTGGALLLGVDGVCIISHGSSNDTAIVNAVRVAAEAVEADLVGALRTAVGS